MIRITGGVWGGRRIETPRGESTRPAADAYRARVMGILGTNLPGLRVLDLFAGSGAFGLECLSRGAAAAVLVESARPALQAIRANVERLGAGATVTVVAGDAYRPPDAVRAGGPFDLVFVAPPYPHFRGPQRARLAALVAALADPALLAADGVAVVQSDEDDFAGFPAPGLEAYDVRRMGRTDFTFLRRAAVSRA